MEAIGREPSDMTGPFVAFELPEDGSAACVKHLHDAVLGAGNDELAVGAVASRIRAVFEPRYHPINLPCLSIVEDDLEARRELHG